MYWVVLQSGAGLSLDHDLSDAIWIVHVKFTEDLKWKQLQSFLSSEWPSEMGKSIWKNSQKLCKKNKIRRDHSSAEITNCRNTRWITTVQAVVLQKNLQGLHWVTNRAWCKIVLLRDHGVHKRWYNLKDVWSNSFTIPRTASIFPKQCPLWGYPWASRKMLATWRQTREERWTWSPYTCHQDAMFVTERLHGWMLFSLACEDCCGVLLVVFKYAKGRHRDEEKRFYFM